MEGGESTFSALNAIIDQGKNLFQIVFIVFTISCGKVN
jgi:hypothetical protein